MPKVKFITRSAKETQKVAQLFVRMLRSPTSKKYLISGSRTSKPAAAVIALEGNLGSGKTTFVQGFARALGIKENVLSPTFVLMKIYKLRSKTKDKRRKLKHLIHIDCYRLDSPKDLAHLGFKDLLNDQDAVILIEWADRVRKFIPRSAIWIVFRHGRHPHVRVLKFKIQNAKFKMTIKNSKWTR